ncbi:MAG: hypothetical protein ACLFS7_00245 [Desulfosudaceae bacterium]
MKKQKQKKQQKKIRSGLMFIWIVVLMLFLTESFLYAWCQVQCVRLRYEISRTKGTAASLASQRKTLRIQLAELKSPVRIMRLAENELGLVMPETNQFVVMP